MPCCTPPGVWVTCTRQVWAALAAWREKDQGPSQSIESLATNSNLISLWPRTIHVLNAGRPSPSAAVPGGGFRLVRRGRISSVAGPWVGTVSFEEQRELPLASKHGTEKRLAGKETTATSESCGLWSHKYTCSYVYICKCFHLLLLFSCFLYLYLVFHSSGLMLFGRFLICGFAGALCFEEWL